VIPPPENARAFFPSPVSACGIALGPLTLAGAVRLAEIGVDACAPLNGADAYAAAFVLSGMEDFKAFKRRVSGRLEDVFEAVSKAFDDAFATYIKPKPQKDAAISLTPNGLGWPLEIAEFLCAEYGWSFAEASATPVARAFALVAAARQRNGSGNAGFDYVEKMFAESMKGK